MWFAEHLLLHPDSKLVCIDLWSTGGPFLVQLELIDSAGSEVGSGLTYVGRAKVLDCK